MSERLASEHRAEEQAVRFQSPVDLNECAREIVDELERKSRHNQVEAIFGER